MNPFNEIVVLGIAEEETRATSGSTLTDPTQFGGCNHTARSEVPCA